jgi:ankyrin repeat protein
MAIQGSICTMEELCALNADDGSLAPLAMYGSSPLHIAAYSNDLDSARTALKQVGGIDSENYWGFTALEIAIKKGHDEIALLLLGQGADHRHKQKGYLSPIQLAVYLHRWRVLEALRPKLDDPALLKYAFSRGYDQFIADDTKDLRQDDLPRLVRMMLDAGLDPAKGSEPVVFWLLDNNRSRGSKAQLDTLKLLLDHGARADQPEPDTLWTPLHLMADNDQWRLDDGARQVIDLLIAKMGSLDARNRQGLTALQIAMLVPRAETFDKVLYLINAGADDSVEYLCGTMKSPSGISIRKKLDEWHGVLPKSYDCSAYR